MKVRSGFVSNSSSSSYIILGDKDGRSPDDGSGAHFHRLNPRQAKVIIDRLINADIAEYEDRNEQEEIKRRLRKVNVNANPIWLTSFMSDRDPDTELPYFHYCSGGHGGPYDADEFRAISHQHNFEDGEADYYTTVWMIKEDYEASILCDKDGKQLLFDFIDDEESP